MLVIKWSAFTRSRSSYLSVKRQSCSVRRKGNVKIIWKIRVGHRSPFWKICHHLKTTTFRIRTICTILNLSWSIFNFNVGVWNVFNASSFYSFMLSSIYYFRLHSSLYMLLHETYLCKCYAVNTETLEMYVDAVNVVTLFLEW